MFDLHRLSAISALVACFGVLGCGEQPKEAADETVTPAVAGHDHGDSSHSHSQIQEGPQNDAHSGGVRFLGSVEIAGETLELAVSGDIAPPYCHELIVRWFQSGTFCPIFRLHGYRLPTAELTGSGAPNEVWSFGEEAYEIIRELLFLRERLRPYIMEQMKLANERGIPPMRPLFFDFPEDGETWTVEDQFMFGPGLLVAPVLHEGARSREVYLPAGATWTDAWTDETFEGGQRITADAPLDRIPLYLRAGASLPIRAGT